MPIDLSEREQSLGKLAAEVVAKAGGVVSFDQYDSLMKSEIYFPPFNWCTGWGSHHVLKANNDKKCIFAACIMGLVRQTKTGYITPPSA